jgi:recombination protein RecA
MWLNQSRVAVGAYNPMGGPVYCQPGGKAVGFFATLRLELSNIDKLKENKDADPVGFIVQVFASKNRLGPPYRNCKMKYIFGEGFSWLWDYMDMGIKLGAIEKSGSWYEFDGQRMQGYMPMYHLIKGSPELSAQLRHVVDGNAAAEAEIVAQNVDQPLQFDPAKLDE